MRFRVIDQTENASHQNPTCQICGQRRSHDHHAEGSSVELKIREDLRQDSYSRNGKASSDKASINQRITWHLIARDPAPDERRNEPKQERQKETSHAHQARQAEVLAHQFQIYFHTHSQEQQ